MAEWDYENEWGATYDPWFPENYLQSPAYQQFTSWGDPTGPGSSGDTDFTGEGGGGSWLQSILSSLSGLSGVLGPAISAGGALAGGAIGSNASNDAARLQSDALNRGIDLSTAQWLQQLEPTAPWVQAGQQSLGTLQGLAGQQPPGMPGVNPSVQGSQIRATLPLSRLAATAVSASGRCQRRQLCVEPQQGPQAANYRYTPGDIPQASQHRYTPGAVPTLSGQELLANDPGVQFRQDEARKALEGSAAARGDLLSGQNLKALQSRSQDLASQEYGNAWNRASQQAQLREGWAQTASQMGWGQAESEARLREQVNQIASQQGWNQAHAEAVFREQMAQQSQSTELGTSASGPAECLQSGASAEQWGQKQQEAYSHTTLRPPGTASPASVCA